MYDGPRGGVLVRVGERNGGEHVYNELGREPYGRPLVSPARRPRRLGYVMNVGEGGGGLEVGGHATVKCVPPAVRRAVDVVQSADKAD